MNLDTTRFGMVEVDEQTVITFTQPIIGFQEFRRFVLLDGPDGGDLKWLQSIDSGELAFILMNPRQVVPDYTIKLGNHELSELAVTSSDELDVYTLVVVPQDPSLVRTNLKAPILINPKQRLGKQTILDKSSYPVQFVLSQATSNGDETQEEMDHARPNA
jgi:flagellar assembly factor FliW